MAYLLLSITVINYSMVTKALLHRRYSSRHKVLNRLEAVQVRENGSNVLISQVCIILPGHWRQ